MIENTVSRDQAIRRLYKQARLREAVDSSPHQAIGLVAAQNITAFCDVPESPTSLRDGFAVRTSDLGNAGALNPVVLRVTQVIRAESLGVEPVLSGQAARVLTGGMVPEGADAVLAEEDVEIDGDEIRVTASVRPGWCVRPRGGEIAVGSVITRAGEVVTPQAAAVMIRTRSTTVRIHSVPEAMVYALGSELSNPMCESAPCDTARFPADNLVMASGLLERSGAHVCQTGVLPDSEEQLIALLSRDDLPQVVVTTGGTGRSERDFARAGAQQAGFTILFDRLDIRPGRNMFAAYRGETLLFCLPGPPAAVFACFHAVILPVIRRLRGVNETPPVLARFEEGLSVRPGGQWLVLCALEHKGSVLTATPLIGKKVPPMLAMGHAHGVAIMDSGESILPGGEAEIWMVD